MIGYRNNIRSLALTVFLTIIYIISSTGCQSPDRTLTLVSSPSGHPVEGALVYAPGDLTVYRSDVHGRVTLPAGSGFGPRTTARWSWIPGPPVRPS